MSDRCRTCRQPVRWVVMTKTGRRMPVDYAPSPDGNVHIFADGERAQVLRQEDIEFARAEGTPLYVSHFKSCPDAAEHRKPKQEALT